MNSQYLVTLCHREQPKKVGFFSHSLLTYLHKVQVPEWATRLKKLHLCPIHMLFQNSLPRKSMSIYQLKSHFWWSPKTEVWTLFSKFFTANILFWEHLGVACLFVFVEKWTSYTFPWTRDSQCQNSAYSLARNTTNAL